jgi:hypothetical protein
MTRLCTACGAALAADQRFCTACGAAVGATPTLPSVPAALAAALSPPTPGSAGLGRGRLIVVGALVGVGALTATALLLAGPDAPPPARTTAPPVQPAAPPPAATLPAATPPAVASVPARPPPGIAAPPPPVTAVTAARWQRYTNSRYGAGVDYPAELFTAEPPPPDNAGRGFAAPAEKARFSVYSHANALDVSRDELLAEDILEIGDDKPQKVMRADGYAVIGARDGEMIVRRVLLSEGGAFVHRLEIAYPLAHAKRFEAIMGRMIGSFAVDPSIPERAAQAAERAAAPLPPVSVGPPAAVTSPPSASPPSRQRVATLPPPLALQAIDSIRLGLRAPGTGGSAGVALQIPATWTRVAVPDKFLLEYGAPAAGGGRLRLLIEAVRIAGRLSLVREAEAIKSVIKPGVDNYREQDEADITVAGRPARRLTLTFVAMDDPAPQWQDYLLVRAGDTLFKIMVDGPERDAAAIRSVFDRVVGSLAVAE